MKPFDSSDAYDIFLNLVSQVMGRHVFAGRPPTWPEQRSQSRKTLVLRLILAPSCNALVSLLKQSSLAAVIAVPEVMNRGWILSSETFRPIEVLTVVALIYFVLTWPLVLLAAALERQSSLAFRSD